MIETKVRYEFTDVNLKISNVTPREAEESYVLIRVSDEDNEIVFALSHEKAEYLENELYEANRRWKEHSSSSIQNVKDDADEQILSHHHDQFSD
ncbi:MAG: hypothetical protein JWM44_4047 [Bacilli bacterium]|nr:hypothetical protein [Bacilli bacterium]